MKRVILLLTIFLFTTGCNYDWMVRKNFYVIGANDKSQTQEIRQEVVRQYVERRTMIASEQQLREMRERIDNAERYSISEIEYEKSGDFRVFGLDRVTLKFYTFYFESTNVCRFVNKCNDKDYIKINIPEDFCVFFK